MDLDITDRTLGEIVSWFRDPVPATARVEYAGCGMHMVLLVVPDDTALTEAANRVFISQPPEGRPLTPAEQATEASDRTFGF